MPKVKTCPDCGYEWESNVKGEETKCPKCGHTFSNKKTDEGEVN